MFVFTLTYNIVERRDNRFHYMAVGTRKECYVTLISLPASSFYPLLCVPFGANRDFIA